ncbi:hypothetical protein HIM_09359 [Hirsutella minnesotensis 3608]|uniref:Uncharacterized protein n=1 Tax=Hirsutella minnesotensis 3608 TaxID=1043627 RepID=A0A0F7ZGQ2_9HYPO|nr:hypothetical protein HIM_09359 [Hirsutella minnesotensis 3608]
MASRGLGCLNEAMAALRVSAPRSTTYSRILSRSMATEAAVEPPTQPAIRPGSITRSLYPGTQQPPRRGTLRGRY